ncbi:MAG: CRISPR-associated endonuclease Cas1 [Firmicutes bacterium]|nr:CRISPR-associated endonuclease Cas1 [Bacillota bacterium]
MIASGGPGEVPLVPARMLAEFVFCPRLMYLEWVEQEFEDSADTVEGRRLHERADRPEAWNPDAVAEDEEAPRRVHSLALSDPDLGLTARLDLTRLEGDEAVPVEYKVGRGPNEGAWPADRVQVAAQALLLRAAGYRCDEAVVYYAGSRRQVAVPITDDLVAFVRRAREEMLAAAALPVPPPPLRDSPKCVGCSLAGICLPDEVGLELGADATVGAEEGASQPVEQSRRERIRRLVPARPDRVPLHVTVQGAVVRKEGERLRVTRLDQELAEARVADVSALSVWGNVEVTTPAVAMLLGAGIPILYFSYGGWFRGMTSAPAAHNAPARIQQYKASADVERSLAAARRIVASKIHNARILIRRNAPDHAVLALLQAAKQRAERARSEQALLGVEGHASRLYFGALGDLLTEEAPQWAQRNRRPPRDPVNAVLSYLYAVLLKDAIVAVYSVGLDPYVGLYHHAGYGKPALALDIMEPYRPVVVDSVMLSLFNRRILEERDFVHSSRGVAIRDAARRKVLEEYERRMDTLFEHPIFGYSVSYRRSLEIDARLLSRFVQGELTEYRPLRVR